jgi:hypothetical protein
MSLQTELLDDLKTAMKAKDEVTRDTLRMLKSELGKAELDKGAALSEDEELAILMRGVKTRKESASAYDDGARPELAARERAEILVIEKYLPTALTEEEARASIAEIVAELGLTEKKQMGALMKAIMAKHRGTIDGKMASKIASSLLK